MSLAQIILMAVCALMVAQWTVLRKASPSTKRKLKWIGYGGMATVCMLALFTHDNAFGATGALAILYTAEELPKTSEEAIRVFMENYINGTTLAPPSTWGNQFGDVIPMSSPTAKFPLSLLSLKFQESKGQNRFKGMKEDDFELLVSQYDEGIEGDLYLLKNNVFAFRKWADGPARLQLAEQQHIMRTVALSIIEANAACGWDGLALFHDAHKVRDEAGSTFDNLSAGGTALSVPNFQIESTAMMSQVKDENSQKMIREPDWAILVPTELYQPAIVAFSAALLVSGGAAIDNPWKGKVEIVHVPEFTDANDWYIVEKKTIRSAMPPWLVGVHDPGPDLNLRTFDTNSDFFKNTGKIAISKHIWNGFKAVFPHGIRKVVGA